MYINMALVSVEHIFKADMILRVLWDMVPSCVIAVNSFERADTLSLAAPHDKCSMPSLCSSQVNKCSGAFYSELSHVCTGLSPGAAFCRRGFVAKGVGGREGLGLVLSEEGQMLLLCFKPCFQKVQSLLHRTC